MNFLNRWLFGSAATLLLCGCVSQQIKLENQALQGDRPSLRRVFVNERTDNEDDQTYFQWTYIGKCLYDRKATEDYEAHQFTNLWGNPQKVFGGTEAELLAAVKNAPKRMLNHYRLYQYYAIAGKTAEAEAVLRELKSHDLHENLCDPITAQNHNAPANVNAVFYLQKDRRHLNENLALQGNVAAARKLHNYYKFLTNWDKDKYALEMMQLWQFIADRLENPNTKISKAFRESLLDDDNMIPAPLRRNDLLATYCFYCRCLLSNQPETALQARKELLGKKLDRRLLLDAN